MEEIKFRLIRNNKIVGYEEHRKNPDDDYYEIWHSEDGKKWWLYTYRNGICHDKKEWYCKLKDENKKEIYEGDLLCSSLDDDPSIYEVVFEDGCFRKKYLNWPIGIDKPIITQKEINLLKDKVVGNIHDNPELINENKA